MKKILVAILVLVLCVTALVACNNTDNNEGLERAKEYLDALYKAEPKITAADIERVPSLRVGEDTFTVTWTVEIIDGPQTVTVVPGEGKVIIDVEEATEDVVEDTNYKLTATITDKDGNTVQVTYLHTIPKFKVNTGAEYLAAKAGEAILVDGIVTAILPTGNGATAEGFFMNALDGSCGIYVYGAYTKANDSAEVAVGMTVRVAGEKDVYSGTHELKSASYRVLDTTIQTVEPVDYTSALANAADLKAKELTTAQALLVTIKGVTVGEPGENGYHYFTLGDKKTYVRISSSQCPLTTAQQTEFKQSFEDHFGYTADVTGLITLYSGSFYLTPVTADAFSNFVAPQLTDQQIVDGAKDMLSIDDVIKEAGDVTLPAAGTGIYADATITWALAETTLATLEGNVLKVAELPAEEGTITLTATIAKGDATAATKEFTVTIKAEVTVEYAPVYITAPTPGTYKIAMDTKAVNGKVLYFAGTLNSKGALETTDVATDAVDVVIAAVEGKDGAYTIKVGDKYLEGYLNDGGYNNLRLVDNAAEWAWNAEIGTFVCTFVDKNGSEGTFYFGAYLKNDALSAETMSLSYISYVTGTNAEKINVSQFVGKFATLEEVEYGPIYITAPTPGTYKIAMDTKAVNDKVLYFAGTLNSKGALETTDVATDAVDVVIAAVEGKDGAYTIKVGDKYLEGYLNDGGYNNLRLVDNAAEWAWNAEIGTFVCTFVDKNGSEGTFYFGAYLKNDALSAETMSLSYISYVTGTNAEKINVSQFVGKFATIGVVTPGQGGGETPCEHVDTNPADCICDLCQAELEHVNEEGDDTLCDVCNKDLGSGSTDGPELTHAGTEADPYSVTDALAIANTLPVSGVTAKVYITGTIKSIGSTGTYLKNVYIVDVNDATKEILVYSVNFSNEVTTAYVNDTVTIHGYIKNYNGTLEIADGLVGSTKDYPTFTARTAGTSAITSTGANATVTLGAESGLNGSQFTFTVEVASGYSLVSVKVNGTTVTDVDGTYTGTVEGPTVVAVETALEGAPEAVSLGKVTFGTTTNSAKIGSYTDTWSATENGITLNIANFNNNNNDWSYIKCGRKLDASVASISTGAMAQHITKVVVTVDSVLDASKVSVKLVVASDANFSTVVEEVAGTLATGEMSFNVTTPAAGLYYKVVFDCQAHGTKNGIVQISAVEFFGYTA